MQTKDAGLEIIHNGSLIASTSRMNGQVLVFNVFNRGRICRCQLERFYFNPLALVRLYRAEINLLDELRIEVKAIEKVVEPPCNTENYSDIVRLERYRYLHAAIHGLLTFDDRVGFEFAVNDRVIKIPLTAESSISFAVTQKESGINIGLGASFRGPDSDFATKEWLDTSAQPGDILTICLKPLDEETPGILRGTIPEKSAIRKKMISDYFSLIQELINDRLLTP